MEVSLSKKTFSEAKAAFKPLNRSRMANTAPPARRESGAASDADPPKLASRGLRRRAGIGSKAKAGKKGRPKKLTDGQLKKRVWKEFSIFIRTRGANSDGMNECYTCGCVKPWRELQAGHFIPGRLNANLFSEIGTNPQCSTCNVLKSGNTVIYYQKMEAAHGRGVIDDLIRRNNSTHKWEPNELIDLLAKYKTHNSANPVVRCESP